MTPPTEATNIADLVPPPDGALPERVEQHLPQLTALHLGTPARAVVRFLEQDIPLLVQPPHRLTALQDDAAELVHQTGRLYSKQAVVVMDVEHPALRARRWRGFRLVDRCRDAVNVQDAGEREAAESGTDDRHVSSHADSLPVAYLPDGHPAAATRLQGPADEPQTSIRQHRQATDTRNHRPNTPQVRARSGSNSTEAATARDSVTGSQLREEDGS